MSIQSSVGGGYEVVYIVLIGIKTGILLSKTCFKFWFRYVIQVNRIVYWFT